MDETHVFPLTPRYWQNRLGRLEASEKAAARDRDVTIGPFKAVEVGQTRFRVSIELTKDEAALVVDDIDELLAGIKEDPGLEASAREARRTILERWPNLTPATE